jgi:hypothetical protein
VIGMLAWERTGRQYGAMSTNSGNTGRHKLEIYNFQGIVFDGVFEQRMPMVII